MKVKINNLVYDSMVTPIALLLTEEDKANIANMDLDAKRIVFYNDENWNRFFAYSFMEDLV